MPRKIKDLSGQRFGSLVATKSFRKIPVQGGKRNRTFRLCECDCGNTKEIAPGSLLSGDTTSCGCQKNKGYPSSKKLPYDIRYRNIIYSTYKHQAMKRNLEFSIDYNDAVRLFESNCHYCGIMPSNCKITKNGEYKFLYSGIDRVDSSMGYISGNCVPCCQRCNVAKNDMGYEEFIAMVKRIYDNIFAYRMAAD